DVLNMVALVGPPVFKRPASGPREDDGRGLRLDGRDVVDGCFPGVVDDDLGIRSVLPWMDIAGRESESLVSSRGLLARGVFRRRSSAFREEVPIVGLASSPPPFAVDPEGAEAPLAGLHLGDLGCPEPPVSMPGANGPPAADDCSCFGLSRVRDRSLARARVFWLKQE